MKAGAAMSDTIVLPFPRQPDLAATMEIQVPALAWQPRGSGWERAYRVDGTLVDVTVTEDDRALRYHLSPVPGPSETRHLEQLLREHFPRQIGGLDLAAHPALAVLRDRYQGTVIMGAEPFEALVVTILSQNRTGEITRKAYAQLDARCGGLTPSALAAISPADLRGIIRSAGPYKAPRLHAIAQKITADGHGAFSRAVTRLPGPLAVSYLTALPGVGHKTAACVLVYAGQSAHTMPVDTHLFRVADRLGLAPHNGILNPATRDRIVAALLGYGPDVAAAHFLFLLLGRSTCTAGTPRCADCFARPLCPTAGVAGTDAVGAAAVGAGALGAAAEAHGGQ
jgi:endonuclease III